MIHIIEGQGKGKTTTAVGLAVRAAGHGRPVLFIQFLKDGSSGEIGIMKMIPDIRVLHSPVHFGFTFQMNKEQLDMTAEAYDKLLDAALESEAFLIVLDESLHALNAGLIKKEKLLGLLEKDAEIVLTGRDAPAWLLEKADYISDIQNKKHPFDSGIPAREGIEF